ncbi:MAG: SMI1/KNR4 family protein [Myxococcales bacterium]|nr:SMI1/KNR4 family protein [Myxococcales bacterium]
MEWDHAAYPPEVLRCSFGDRAREGDGASWRALAEQFEDHAWVIAAPEVREPRSAAPSLSIWTYTMHAARRHDVPVAERRVLEEMRWLVGQLSTWAERIGRELELTYEGEEIGWIVRGEVSEELRRFLDRWERTLRDDVASRVQRDEGRVDDGDEGKVSIWLGDLRDEAELAALLVPASPARSPLRRALGLRTVPEGELEARWAPRAPVGALLAPMSFGASFADAVAAVARARSIDTASAVIAYFDHAHEPAQALPEQDGARLRFVGVFSYDEAVEARPASEVEPMPARLATQVRPWRHYLPRLHDHRAATAERLDTLERSLGATLPPDYRVFLRHLGGAVPSAGTLVSPIDDLAWKAGPVAVGEFLGFRIDGGPALDPFGRIPVDLLPIARTEGDDRFCLGIGGSYRDEVWLWAHDAPRAAAASSEGPWHECLYRVAATFAAFLERLELRPWEDSPVLDPEGVDVDAVIARSAPWPRRSGRSAPRSSARPVSCDPPRPPMVHSRAWSPRRRTSRSGWSAAWCLWATPTPSTCQRSPPTSPTPCGPMRRSATAVSRSCCTTVVGNRSSGRARRCARWGSRAQRRSSAWRWGRAARSSSTRSTRPGTASTRACRRRSRVCSLHSRRRGSSVSRRMPTSAGASPP